MELLLHFSKHNPQIWNDFLLKPIRDCKGQGIVFGSDMTADQWIVQIGLLQQVDFVLGQTKYVVQRRIEQPRFPLLLNGSAKTQHQHLVGTYMAINGRYFGLGFSRTSSHRISALSQGGDWVCIVTKASAVAKL